MTYSSLAFLAISRMPRPPRSSSIGAPNTAGPALGFPRTNVSKFVTGTISAFVLLLAGEIEHENKYRQS